MTYLRFFIFLAIVLPINVSADTLFGKAIEFLDSTICLYKKTETMCFVEDIADNASETVLISSKIYGKSEKYYLVSEHENWLKVTLDKKSKDDLLLVDSNNLGFISVVFKEEVVNSFENMAKEPLMEMAGTLESEPEKVEADFWPWKSNGSMYLLCYETNKETVECMLSAVANIPEGHVVFFSLFSDSDNDVLIDSTMQFILSIDIPENFKIIRVRKNFLNRCIFQRVKPVKFTINHLFK